MSPDAEQARLLGIAVAVLSGVEFLVLLVRHGIAVRRVRRMMRDIQGSHHPRVALLREQGPSNDSHP